MIINKNIKKIFFQGKNVEEIKALDNSLWVQKVDVPQNTFLVFDKPIGKIFAPQYINKNNLINYTRRIRSEGRLFVYWGSGNGVTNVTTQKKLTKDEIDELTKGITYYEYHFLENNKNKIVKTLFL